MVLKAIFFWNTRKLMFPHYYFFPNISYFFLYFDCNLHVWKGKTHLRIRRANYQFVTLDFSSSITVFFSISNETLEVLTTLKLSFHSSIMPLYFPKKVSLGAVTFHHYGDEQLSCSILTKCCSRSCHIQDRRLRQRHNRHAPRPLNLGGPKSVDKVSKI